ncbi:peroxidase-like [Amblyomma americanum]
MNSRTSFIDSSHIYGISGDIMDSLRAFDRGLLKYHSVNGSMFLPLSPVPENDTCSLFEEDKICLRAGDLRNNQNPGLIWLHTLFVREHNRIANKLATINAHWDDEKVFQVTKRIVDSRFQHVVYNEWLPGIVGADAMDKYDLWPLKEGYTKYDPRVDSTIINEFSTAAFRFGHSNVQGHFDLINEDGIKMGSIQLEDGYFQPFNYKGIEDNAFRGLIRQPMQTTDRFGDRALTNFLFRSPGRPYGADLFAIDIQRGRDHGIRPYADYVQLCRNVTLKTFADLSRLKLMPDDVEKLYSHVYEDVRDIDFFSAGLNEPLVPGASLGPTFLCVVAEMFGRLKRGDRFYYEHGGQAGSFTPEQLRTIRETTLAKIICENTGVKKNLQRNVFQLLDSKECNLTCADFPEIQLELWDSNSGGDYSGNEAQLEA